MALVEQGALGLKKVYIAVLDNSTDVSGGNPSWDTPIQLAAAGKLSFDPGASQAQYFAGDGVFQTASQNGLGKITLNLLDVVPSTLATILGKTYSAGQTLYQSSDSPVNVAVIAQVTRNGGVYEYVVFYKVQFMDPKDGWESKSNTAKFAEMTLEGTGMVLTSNGYSGLRQRSDDTAGSSSAITNWFTTVQLPGANLNALTVTAAQGGSGASSTAVYTFAKTGGGSFRINTLLIDSTNLPIYKAGVLQAGTYVDTTGAAGTTQVVTFTPTSAWAAAQKITVTATAGMKDTNNIGCTPYSVELTLT